MADADGDFAKLIEELADYDESVAVQAASLWQANHQSLLDESIQDPLRKAAPETKSGFFRYLTAWRASQQARLSSP